ncbi:MAG: flagellar basal body P-ring protein FlgI [Planctomycetota bacterium]|jgi:flagellar P-ring protein precursor FlgI
MRCWLSLLLLPALAAGVRAERIKDIVEIQGVRSNPIWGYGLVVGLNGSGDDSDTSRRAMANILRRTGMAVDSDDVKSKNIASVIVTAELPPFGRTGSKLDVTVSAIGDASSLQGGMLLMTPMVGGDGEVYAVAQGAISIGGFSAKGGAAAMSKNHPTVGRIPEGATIEKEELATYVEDGKIILQVRNADFTTSQRVAQAINKMYPNAAKAGLRPGAGSAN